MTRLLGALASLWATLLLGLCYFLVIGPVCALARALGWDPLERRGGAGTYWRAREGDGDGCSERTY